MPYSFPGNVPRPAKNWTDSEKKKCVSAANAVLGDGGSEEEAIYACIHAAGKSKRKEMTEEIQSDIDDVDVNEDVIITSEVAEEPEEKEIDEGLIDRFINWVKGISTKDKEPDPNTIMFFKGHDDQWTWFARYSNKYRDDDRPVKEIIAERSHLRFVDLVKSGQVNYPELWLWHVPGTAWGKSTWVGYDTDGFAMAAGHIYPEFGEVAAAFKGRNDILLSHGMPKDSIRRDADDPSIIVEHITKEISVLPSWAAANKLTFFLLEDNMNEQKSKGLSPEDRHHLVDELGVPENLIERIMARNAEDARKAAEMDLESKEANETQEEPDNLSDELDGGSEEVEAQEETHEGEQGTQEDANESEVEVAEAAEGETPVAEPELELVNNELAQGLIKALGELSKNVLALNERIDDIDKEVKALSDATNEIKGTPSASFASHFARSVIGAEETRVDGRTKLAKDRGPAESTGAESGGFFFDEYIRQG